jgi:DNA-binding NtrC family response regulator
MSLELPPVREREGDLPLLIRHFLGPDWDIEPEALQALQTHDWPGNVRQLMNAIERGKIMSEGHTIRLRDLPREVTQRGRRAPAPAAAADPDDLASIERSKVVEILRREQGNKTRAARALGIDRRKVYRLVAKYDIQDAEVQARE